MSDLAKIIGILIAVPSFIIALIILFISSWVEGISIDVILQAFNANPLLIFGISILGIIALIFGVITLIKNTF
jgi:hypothetical protein